MNRLGAAIGLMGALLSLAACGGGTDNKAAAPAPAAASGPAAAPPPPAVGVLKVTPADVGLLTELPGRTEASRVAQVRARAAGILTKRLFDEGSDVTAGQPLFTIDPAPYQAAVASAQAQVARAEAALMQAQANADRARGGHFGQGLLPGRLRIDRFLLADGLGLEQRPRAALQTAQLNLGYASVSAPIAGRIGRAQVTEGALVGQGEATPMALIQQVDPLYVNFTQPAADVLRLRAAIARGQFKQAGPEAASVTLHLEDGSTHPLPGKLLFSDLSVDPTTGQITLRAIVPNPKKTLLPGLFVRVRVEQAQAPGAMLLPQQAVSRGPQGDTVRVVGEDGMVDVRPVKVGPARDGQWVVLEGLKAGEQVMVDGFQKLRGKGPVNPVPWTPASTASPAKPPSKG
ncbi:MAG: efflux RND transporter periplasmic adaptor subunit [Betaproteobacteria bacterium]